MELERQSPTEQTMTETSKKTPIYDSHVRLGAKMVDFAGWQMPIQYEGLREEHDQTRTDAGLFDVSHMGEIRVKGPESLATLQWVTTNDVAKLQSGQAQYSLFPNKNGGIVDDLIVYCIKPGEEYLLCVNAANTAKDFAFIQANNRGAILENESARWGQIAIQGPKAIAAIEKVTKTDFGKCPGFQFVQWNYQGKTCYIARTGYTGEDGAEIFVPWESTDALWNEFLTTCPNAKPIGLGARDTLRTEMKYPLYGQDISDLTNPYEAGLGWVVKPDKGEFLGKAEMLAGKKAGLTKKLVGLEIQGKGIARPGYPVFSVDSAEIGVVTSGTFSPSLNKAIAIAYVANGNNELGTKVLVQMRNKMIEAEIVKTPFYQRG